MANNISEGMLHIGNIHMRYVRFGKGSSDLIVLQGLNTNGLEGKAALLARTYRDFAEKYTVTVIDRREEVTKEITVRQMAADTALAMDELKIRNADILGISQGGMIAQCLAIDRPELVHKLVLTVTTSRNNPTGQQVTEYWAKLTEEKRFEELFADMAEKVYSEAFFEKMKPLLPMLTAAQTPKNADRFVFLTRACFFDIYEELDKIKCPVFVIGGEKDKVLTGNASLEIAQKLGCELYMYENLGHAVNDEAKDFNKRVLDFLCREEKPA